MKYINDFFSEFQEKVKIPQEATKVFENLLGEIEKNPDFSKTFQKARQDFMYPKANNLNKYLDKLSKCAEKYNVNEYTLHFVFLMVCAEDLLKRYRENNLSEELFWDTMQDLRYKLLECISCKGVWGTFVGDWFGGFYELDRFALGRFQFEPATFDRLPYRTKSGAIIKTGEKVINFHIPWSGVSLTDDVRLDSYKKAYKFYKDYIRPDGLMIFECDSWLLYPEHYNFLDKSSNVLRFMDDFEIISSKTKDKFYSAWRLYGGIGNEEPEKWPETNSLFRAYKKHILEGGKSGSGFGIFAFDGEKILK